MSQNFHNISPFCNLLPSEIDLVAPQDFAVYEIHGIREMIHGMKCENAESPGPVMNVENVGHFGNVGMKCDETSVENVENVTNGNDENIYSIYYLEKFLVLSMTGVNVMTYETNAMNAETCVTFQVT